MNTVLEFNKACSLVSVGNLFYNWFQRHLLQNTVYSHFSIKLILILRFKNSDITQRHKSWSELSQEADKKLNVFTFIGNEVHLLHVFHKTAEMSTKLLKTYRQRLTS